MASVAGFSNHTIGSLDGWPSFPKSILGSLTAHSQTVCLPLPQDLRMRDIERIAKMPHSVAHLLLHLPLLLTLVSVGFYARLWDLRRNHSIDLVPRIPAPMYDRRAMPFAMTKLRWRVIGDYNQLKKKAHYETPLESPPLDVSNEENGFLVQLANERLPYTFGWMHGSVHR